MVSSVDMMSLPSTSLPAPLNAHVFALGHVHASVSPAPHAHQHLYTHMPSHVMHPQLLIHQHPLHLAQLPLQARYHHQPPSVSLFKPHGNHLRNHLLLVAGSVPHPRDYSALTELPQFLRPCLRSLLILQPLRPLRNAKNSRSCPTVPFHPSWTTTLTNMSLKCSRFQMRTMPSLKLLLRLLRQIVRLDQRSLFSFHRFLRISRTTLLFRMTLKLPFKHALATASPAPQRAARFKIVT